MRAALREVLEIVGDKASPTAAEIRAACKRGLGEED